MGQYYSFMNIDKKEVCQRNWHNIKLMEHSYYGNDYCADILNLLNNEWKGDRILHVGDYAHGKDRTITQKLIAKIEKENKLNTSVYHWSDTFDDVIPSFNNNIRYVYNHNKKEYVDLLNQPIQWCYYDEKTNCISFTKINSFALLIGCGNGLGGGDYRRCINDDKVGYWAGDHFTSSDKLLDEFKNYKQNNYIFNEMLDINKKIKLWNKKTEEEICNAEVKYLEEYIDNYQKYHQINFDKLDIDISDLTSTETVNLTTKLSQVKDKYKSKEGDICL